jgi:hypothetical protein
MAILRRFEVTPCTATVAAHGIFVFVHDDHIADDNFRRKLLYILRPLGRQGDWGRSPPNSSITTSTRLVTVAFQRGHRQDSNLFDDPVHGFQLRSPCRHEHPAGLRDRMSLCRIAQVDEAVQGPAPGVREDHRPRRIKRPTSDKDSFATTKRTRLIQLFPDALPRKFQIFRLNFIADRVSSRTDCSNCR